MREKILKILKDSDKYVSGEEISHVLGISRAAVWKHIQNLKNEGYKIESVTNKGYKLGGIPDKLDIDKIHGMLKTKVIGQRIKYVNSTDSTNNECKRLEDKTDGTLVIADAQTAGKGRLGRVWKSPHGSGIWMSILLKPDVSLESVSQITLIAGMAVCRAVGIDAMIKWPNDVVIGGKKICGILTEMSAEIERINYVICGIGINVNIPSFPEELQDKATSMLVETGKKHDRERIAADVLNEFEKLYNSFIEKGFSFLADEYRKMCVTLNKDVRVIYRNNELTGKAVDIDDSGNLIVETENGQITVHSGEVSVRGIYGYI